MIPFYIYAIWRRGKRGIFITGEDPMPGVPFAKAMFLLYAQGIGVILGIIAIGAIAVRLVS